MNRNLLIPLSIIILILLSGCIEISQVAGDSDNLSDIEDELSDTGISDINSNEINLNNSSYSISNESELSLFLLNTSVKIYDKNETESYYRTTDLISNEDINLVNYMNDSEIKNSSELIDNKTLKQNSDQNISSIIYLSQDNIRKYVTVNDIKKNTNKSINLSDYNSTYETHIYTTINIKKSTKNQKINITKIISEETIISSSGFNLEPQNITYIGSKKLNHSEFKDIDVKIYEFDVLNGRKNMKLIYSQYSSSTNSYMMSGIIKKQTDNSEIINLIKQTKLNKK